jgi:hypothetical protein
MKSPRNIAIILAVTLLIAFWISTLFVSAETLIRREIAGIIDGFNSPDVGDATAALRDDFKVHTPRGRAIATKNEVQNYLRHLVLTAKDPKTKLFNLSLAVPEESIEIQLAEDELGAEVSFPARISKTRGDVTSAWSIQIIAQFEDGDDGWQVVSAIYETIDGKPPF